MIAWAFVDYLLVSDLYECAGDHAGGWETSHMMALHPHTVNLDLLPLNSEKLVGAGGKMHPKNSTAAFGREIIEKAVDIVVKEALHRLEYPELYMGHGVSLREGLWKNK